jgi:pyruvate,water dikinase
VKKKTNGVLVRWFYDVGGSKMVKNVPVAPADRTRFALTDDEILALARWGCIIEDHYRRKVGRDSPIQAIRLDDVPRLARLDGLGAGLDDEQLAVIPSFAHSMSMKETGRRLIEGRSIGEKIATGRVRVIPDVHRAQEFQAGEVLVTDKTDPDWEPIMKRAAAIVTNRGGRTCHAAIVSRELGLPAIVGTERGTEALRDGQQVTVSCAEGDIGVVYDGTLPFDVERVNLTSLKCARCSGDRSTDDLRVTSSR